MLGGGGARKGILSNEEIIPSKDMTASDVFSDDNMVIECRPFTPQNNQTRCKSISKFTGRPL